MVKSAIQINIMERFKSGTMQLAPIMVVITRFERVFKTVMKGAGDKEAKSSFFKSFSRYGLVYLMKKALKT